MGSCYKVTRQTPIFCFQGGPIQPCFGAVKRKDGSGTALIALEVGFQAFLPLKNPIFRPFVSKNGSETAGETADFRPRSRPALLQEVINDRGELHCRRTMHRGDVRVVAFRVGVEPSGHRTWY